MSGFLFRSIIPRPHAAHEVAGLGPDRGGVDRGGVDRGGVDRGGVDRGGRERGVSEDGRDRGERNAGGNSSDAVAVAKARGHACGPSMPAVRMIAPTWRFAVCRVMGQRGRVAPRALPWSRLSRCTSSRACTILGDRNGPPVVRPALQVRDSEFARLEVDIARADPERLGHPAPGHREGARQGLDARSRVRAGRGEEALALRPGEIFPAACVDQGERAVGHEPEKLHYFMSNDQASGRPPLPAALQRPLPARPWLRGVPKRDSMCIDRDRGAPHGAAPPTPPGIRVRTTAVRPD